MKPSPRAKTDFEQVVVDEWITGEIEEIKYDLEHKSMYEGKERIRAAVRFKFKLDGYDFPHYSRWLTFNYSEKSNLYKEFLTPLVEGAKPDIEFDLDQLKDMKIKTMWTQNDEYQNLKMIRPLNKKVVPTGEPAETDAVAENEIPF